MASLEKYRLTSTPNVAQEWPSIPPLQGIPEPRMVITFDLDLLVELGCPVTFEDDTVLDDTVQDTLKPWVASLLEEARGSAQRALRAGVGSDTLSEPAEHWLDEQLQLDPQYHLLCGLSLLLERSSGEPDLVVFRR